MNLPEYKEIKMQDPEFAKAYDDVQPEMDVIKAIISSQNLCSKQSLECSEDAHLKSGYH